MNNAWGDIPLKGPTQEPRLAILGIDPGLASVGVGVIEHVGRATRVAHEGDIRTPTQWDLARRLKYIHDAIREVAKSFKPDAAAIEKIYFAKNVKTAVDVAQGRGVAILATADEGIELFEYTPLQIKQAVAGYGRAGKEQIQKMVGVLLGMKTPPKSDHTADALAAAICHTHHIRMKRLVDATKRGGRRPR